MTANGEPVERLTSAVRHRMLKAALLTEFSARSDMDAEHLWELADEMGLDHDDAERLVEAVTDEVRRELDGRVNRLGGSPYRDDTRNRAVLSARGTEQ